MNVKNLIYFQLDFMTNTSIEYIYNPIDYARQTHEQYLQLYANQVSILLLLKYCIIYDFHPYH